MKIQIYLILILIMLVSLASGADYNIEVDKSVKAASQAIRDSKIIQAARERVSEEGEGAMVKNRIRESEEIIIKNKDRIRTAARNITLRELNQKQKEIIAGKINAKTGLNLSAEEIDENNIGENLKAYLSNGRYAYIRYMPDSASRIALERMRAKCDERNCSVELIEVRKGNESRAVYVVNAEKESRFLFLFNKKIKLSAQIDAETGEVLSVARPWWAFLAREKDTSDKEIEESIEIQED